MFSVAVDRSCGLYEVKLTKMMTVDDVGRYAQEIRRLFVSSGLRSYSIIIGLADCPIQSQQATQALAEHMAAMPKATSIAVITGSSLAQMQVRRLFTQPYARVTGSVDRAREWVLHGVEPTDSPSRAQCQLPVHRM